MAATYASTDHAGKQPSAPALVIPVTATLDNSYPTGGYAFNAGEVARDEGGYSNPVLVLGVVGLPKGNFIPEWDATNNKLIVRQISDGAEVANTTDLSTTPGTLDLLVFGK